MNRFFIEDGCFQGELCFRRVAELPREGLREAVRVDGVLIVGHSETGHHHVVEAADARLLESPDPLVAYLVAEGAYADVTHLREFDTHATLSLAQGTWQVIRQREHSPAGWRPVAD